MYGRATWPRSACDSPYPEAAINAALALYTNDIDGVEQLKVKVNDGHFEVITTGRKIIPFMARTRLKIAECNVTRTVQTIKLRQLQKTDVDTTGLLPTRVLAFIKAVLFSALRIDPARYLLSGQPGIEASDDIYTVNLSQTTFAGYLQNNRALGLMHIKDAASVAGHVNVKLAI